MLSPSAIQRMDDLVGIEMPIAPLSAALATGITAMPEMASARLAVSIFIVVFISGLHRLR